ncbi:MAG TPA: alkene reductase [Pyrinomonadaceae bacterium]|nr:alkene reductase [Pyrinomonadaceae bacterium]
MTTLFNSLRIGNIELKNRMIIAPMTRSRANDEGVQPDYAATYYEQRASAGLIITEAVNVSPMAKGYVRTPGIYTDEQIESWRKVTEAVHWQGGKIFMQIFHTGRIALPDFLPDNQQPVAPTAIRAAGQNYTDEGMKDFVTPRELTVEEIKQTVKDFAQAAKNAIKAGFDGVEIHGANGYLIQQFLSTNVNLRTDEYGGNIENRSRFLFEIIDAVTSEIGSHRTSLKLSPGNKFNDIAESDAVELYRYIATKLNEKNLAYLYIGTDDQTLDWHNFLRPVYNGVYFAGNGYTRESGTDLLTQGGADAIVYGKLFLANPDLPERFNLNAPLNEPDTTTFYAGGRKGYIDYPSLMTAATIQESKI